MTEIKEAAAILAACGVDVSAVTDDDLRGVLNLAAGEASRG